MTRIKCPFCGNDKFIRMCKDIVFLYMEDDGETITDVNMDEQGEKHIGKFVTEHYPNYSYECTNCGRDVTTFMKLLCLHRI